MFPFQADLEAGLDRHALYTAEIEPELASHIAPAIEEVVRDWVRREALAGVTRVGSWWGPASNDLRRSGERSSEEIDVVGVVRGRVVLVGEVRWRSDPMELAVLGELDRYKLPALRQATRVETSPTIVLVSRAGFTAGLHDAALGDARIHLVELADLVR